MDTPKTNNLFRVLLILSLFTIGFGLILNGVTSATATVVPSAQSDGIVAAEPTTTETTFDDVLSQLHTGQWFGWSDPNNKVYENLVVLDQQYEKPTLEFLQAEVTSVQSTKDLRKAERDILKANRKNVEARLLSGAHSDADVIEYLRMLGGF